MKAQLTDNLKELHLPAMRGCLEGQARQAQQESQSYEGFDLGIMALLQSVWVTFAVPRHQGADFGSAVEGAPV
jgi:hypothetical protein